MAITDSINLTDQQLAIVRHDSGPARVFAVAGAGKTTAMVHRIARLVDQRIFPASRIMASSFNNATVNELKASLQQWPNCHPVKTRTLHQVGNWVLKMARARGYLKIAEYGPEDQDIPGADRLILNLSLARAREQKLIDRADLEELDQEDFLAQVGLWKGNLCYANLTKASLPEEALKTATQATAPAGFEWYLDLYRLFEEIGQERGLITFDDMLQTGWELLLRHADLLEQLQRQAECVLVDEFQDINLAQFEILDLLTAKHRNYMVIGDDDQTIYEWRGAHPRFILTEFGKRYQPHDYLLNDNFRSHAAPLVLANRVIELNKQRHPKFLSLTKGFGGVTEARTVKSKEEQGRSIVAEIKANLAKGVAPTQIAVLVRLYAQTSYIEQYLIKESIPYQVTGNLPFYQRPEIAALLDFCRIARTEKLLTGDKELTTNQWDEFTKAWDNTTVPLARFLPKEVRRGIKSMVIQNKAPVSAVILSLLEQSTNDRMLANLEKLAETLRWLAGELENPYVGQVLDELETRLKYRDYLRKHSGFAENGEARAASVDAFIDYARGKGTLSGFMQHMKELEQTKAGYEADNAAEVRKQIILSSIHQAKGLEWEVVFVPDCNQGTIPFWDAKNQPAKLEEERRLFYVALTRTKRELYLYLVEGKEVSRFLQEARYNPTLEGVKAVGAALAKDPANWQAQDVLPLARQVRPFHLERYFKQWWKGSPQLKQQIATRVQEFYGVAAKQKALATLGLEAADQALWREILPLAANKIPDDFPGLAALVQKKLNAAPANVQNKSLPNPAPKPNKSGLKSGDRVKHNTYGEGFILRMDSSQVDELALVKFDDGEIKKFSVRYGNLELLPGIK